MTSTHSSTRPTAVKSMPCPGVKSTPPSMSARRLSPRARTACTTSALDAPERKPRPTTPATITSVAWPRIFGPSTASPTLVMPAASSAPIAKRSGRSSARNRRPEFLKSNGFSVDMPPAIQRPGPGPCAPCGPGPRWAAILTGLVICSLRWGKYVGWSYRGLLLGQLGEHDLPIGLVVGHQLGVGTRSDDPSLVEDHDPVGVADGVHPLSHD